MASIDSLHIITGWMLKYSNKSGHPIICVPGKRRAPPVESWGMPPSIRFAGLRSRCTCGILFLLRGRHIRTQLRHCACASQRCKTWILHLYHAVALASHIQWLSNVCED